MSDVIGVPSFSTEIRQMAASSGIISFDEDQIRARISSLRPAARAQIRNDPYVVGGGQKGPDLHVLEGRQDRAIGRARRVSQVQGSTPRMSSVDVDKLQASNSGTSLNRIAPGLDAFARNNSPAQIAARESQVHGTVPSATAQHDAYMRQTPAQYQAGMRSRVAGAAADHRALASTSKVTSVRPVPSVARRTFDIGETLKPGEKAAISQGAEAAGVSVADSGRVDAYSLKTQPGFKMSAGPGKVRTDDGRMVPIGEETARLAAPINAAGDRKNTGAAEMAGHMRGVIASNPNVQAGNAVRTFQQSQAAKYAAPDPFRTSPTFGAGARSTRLRRIASI